MTRMSAVELDDWRWLDATEPVGPRRLDLQLAILCATVANAAGKKRDGTAFSIEDFLIKPYEGEVEQQSVEEMERLFMQNVLINNARYAGRAEGLAAAREEQLRAIALGGVPPPKRDE